MHVDPLGSSHATPGTPDRRWRPRRGTAEQQLRHGFSTSSDQMAPRPRLTSRNVLAFILALLLTLSDVAFHATQAATWTWQPELQPLVPRPSGFSSASQSTWPEASSSVIREDSNQSGLALPDLEQNGRMWSSSQVG